MRRLTVSYSSFSLRYSHHLNGCESGHDGGRPEAVGDEGEVGEVPLDGGVQQGLGPRVAQRAAVLVQEVHQLLAK